jgi:hypothetical protein
MRIVPAVLLLLALLPQPAAAQETLTYGVKGGLNVSSASVSVPGLNISPDSRTGVVVGGFVGADFHEYVGMQVEALYSQKGAQVTEFGIEIDLRLDYVEIPILARGNVRLNPDTRIHVIGGPAFAFKVHDDLDIEDFGLGFGEIELKSWDAGIAVGGGVTFRSLIFDARYTFGLVNVNDDDIVGDLVDVKNRAFSLTVGWRFR